jgi:hypothetical protein
MIFVVGPRMHIQGKSTSSLAAARPAFGFHCTISRQEALQNVSCRDSGLDKRLISELRHGSGLAAFCLIPLTTI